MKNLLLTGLVAVSTLTSFAQNIDTGLIAHWDFNGNANDVSGNGLNGTVAGPTLTTGYNGLPNTAYLFNGSDNLISVPYDSLMNLDSFSICALVKPMGFYSGTCQGNIIFSRDAQEYYDHYELIMYDNPYDDDCYSYHPNQENFGMDNAGGGFDIPSPYWYDTSVIDTNVWYSVVGTYDGDSLRLYVNGSLRKTIHSNDNYMAGTSGLGIGGSTAYNASNYPYWFNGVIDDIRIYNRAVSQAEVNQIVQSQEAMPTSVGSLSSNTVISLSPNPAKNTCIVTLKDIGAGSSTLQLMNTTGQIVYEQKFTSNNAILNTDILSAGFYIVKIQNNGNVYTDKLIKE